MEEWRDIKGYEGIYQVSNLGRVKSLGNGKKRKEKILKQQKTGRWKNYYKVILFKNGIPKTKKIHRLVAEAFIPNPNNYPCVNHKDENPSNNFVENLEWCSYEYNNNYGTKNKRVSETLKGKNNGWYGKHHSEETRKKMSEAKMGNKNPNYRKRWGYK